MDISASLVVVKTLYCIPALPAVVENGCMIFAILARILFAVGTATS